MAKRRTFTPEFKAKVVLEALCGESSRSKLFDTITSAKTRSQIGHFITQVYHLKRPYSALGYLTPMEFEQQNLS